MMTRSFKKGSDPGYPYEMPETGIMGRTDIGNAGKEGEIAIISGDVARRMEIGELPFEWYDRSPPSPS